MAIPPLLAQTVQKTQEWLKELSDNGELSDTQESLAVLRSVLHHLRDRLTLEEAVDLGPNSPLYFAAFTMKVGSRASQRRGFAQGRSLSMK